MVVAIKKQHEDQRGGNTSNLSLANPNLFKKLIDQQLRASFNQLI